MSTDAPRCIFCRIARKEAPASIVFEDGAIMAFPTIRQTRPGETLIIPKLHVDQFCDVPDETAARIMTLAQRLGRAMREAFEPLRIGYVVSGFGVAHAHLIVLPLHESQDITSARYIAPGGEPVTFAMSHIPETPRADLDRIAADLARRIGAGP